MAGISEIGYNTHILGTVKRVKECLGIMLYSRYNNSSTKSERISLYNIEQIYESLKDGENSVKLTRENIDDPFIYRQELRYGFTTIIYLDQSSSADPRPIGYTDFRYVQGKDRNINISLDLIPKTEEIDIVLNNSLNNVEYIEKNYIGEGLDKYTPSSTALDAILSRGEVFEGNYTKFLNQSKVANGYNYLDSGFIQKFSYTGDLGFVKLNIFKNMNYSPIGYEFENFSTSFYNNDIVLGTWTGLNYCITSLTQKNKFGELIKYTKSSTGYFTLPTRKSGNSGSYISPKQILYNSGKYLICDFEEKRGEGTINYSGAFNIETKEWESSKEDQSVFADLLDPTNKLYILPNSIENKQVYKYIPELTNTFFYNYSEQKEKLRIIRKVGNWFVFKIQETEKRTYYVISGISYSLYILPEQLKDIMFFDDNTLILNTEYSYKIYRGIGEESCTDEFYSAKIVENIIPTNVIKVYKYRNLKDTELNDLRRGPYPITSSSIPDIVTAFCGHLFYVDKRNQIINIL